MASLRGRYGLPPWPCWYAQRNAVMQRCEREQTEDHPPQTVPRQRAVEAMSLIIALGTPRQGQRQLSKKPTRRELECALRRGVHPFARRRSPLAPVALGACSLALIDRSPPSHSLADIWRSSEAQHA